jgi:hypothetical protein
MNDKKLLKLLKQLLRDMRRFETNLKEVKDMTDLNWQVKDFGKTLDKYDPPDEAKTKIHAGGTGRK